MNATRRVVKKYFMSKSWEVTNQLDIPGSLFCWLIRTADIHEYSTGTVKLTNG